MESLAASAFYGGLAAIVFGSIRLARGSLERRQYRDTVGIGALAVGAVALAIAVGIFIRSPRGVLPF